MIYFNKHNREKRAVMKCDKDTLAIIQVYPSITKAAEDLGGNTVSNKRAIQDAANKKIKEYKGFVWRWKPLIKLGY